MELYNGDCIEILKQIKDKSVDLIVTDPPYDVDVNHDGGNLYHAKGFDKSNIELVESKIDNGYDIELYNMEFVRVMKDINVYIWCNKVQIPDYFNFYVNKLKCKFDILCWHKGNALPTYSNKYLSDTEYCLYFRNSGKCFPESYEDARTFYIAPINTKDKNIYGHPTIKPLDFTKKLVRNSSKKNDIVLDPFMGSGTTGVACKELERDFIGVEINEKYFAIAKNRIENTKIQGELLL